MQSFHDYCFGLEKIPTGVKITVRRSQYLVSDVKARQLLKLSDDLLFFLLEQSQLKISSWPQLKQVIRESKKNDRSCSSVFSKLEA